MSQNQRILIAGICANAGKTLQYELSNHGHSTALLETRPAGEMFHRAEKHLSGPADVLIYAGNADQALVMLHEMASHLTTPKRDATGELRASGHAILLIGPRPKRPESEHLTYAMDRASLKCLTREGAHAFAPHLRINAIMPHHGTTQARIANAVQYFIKAPSVTGQIMRLTAQCEKTLS